MPDQLVNRGKSIVLVGLMGAGKTTIGRRLARRLELPFADADEEIVKAAGASIVEIFARHGESVFRDGERRVISRLLNSSPQVVATGGGAFIEAATRAVIARRGISVWLRAELDVLDNRTRGRGGRPLLQTADPRATLAALMDARYPIYAEANVTVDSRDDHPDVTTERVLDALRKHLADLSAATEIGA